MPPAPHRHFTQGEKIKLRIGAREKKSLEAGFENVDLRRRSDVRWKTVPDTGAGNRKRSITIRRESSSTNNQIER